jgi:hypothetical protein
VQVATRSKETLISCCGHQKCTLDYYGVAGRNSLEIEVGKKISTKERTIPCLHNNKFVDRRHISYGKDATT